MKLDERSIALRKLALRCMKGGRRGHIGSTFSLIEIMRTIYDVAAPEDKILLSKGHGCISQYVCLVEKEIIAAEELDKFCQKDAMLGGHPAPHIPSIIAHTGSLGHGAPIGVGLALAAKIKKQNHRVFVIMGDGEINEGSVWEAAMTAHKHNLDNLTFVIDYNKIQSSGFVKDIQPLEPLVDKWKAFGFMTYECDGHDVERLTVELSQRYQHPNCIIAHTIKSKGVSFAENNPSYHYKSGLTDENFEEFEKALDEQAA